MKIFEITEFPLILTPIYVEKVNEKIQVKPVKCEICKGSGRHKGVMCAKCGGKGMNKSGIPQGNVPLFQTSTTELDILKQLLKFKVTNTKGIIFREQIPDIRRLILKFKNSNMPGLDGLISARSQQTKPKAEFNQQTGLHTIVPNNKRGSNLTKDSIIKKIDEFAQFLNDVYQIEHASIRIKDN